MKTFMARENILKQCQQIQHYAANKQYICAHAAHNINDHLYRALALYLSK